MNYRERLQLLGIELDRTGRQTCPQCSSSRHNKTEKCVQVTYNNEGVLYNCHHCGWAGIVPFKENSNKVFPRPIAPEKDETSLDMYIYFNERGISNRVLQKYKISSNAEDEILFPYYKNGELVNIKYRKNLENGKKTFRQTKDAERTLFGMDFVDKTKPLIIVEGEVDVLSFAEQDIYAVSVPNGGNDKDLSCIENCYSFISKFNTFILAIDNDTVGDCLKNNLLNRLGKENCYLVNWGKYKDANEALQDKQDLATFLRNAKPVSPDGIVTYYDNYDSIYKSIFEEDNEYFPTGWSEFDKLVKIRLGYLMTVTGYPGRGKSTFVNNLLVNLTKKYGFKHLIASFESTTSSSYVELLEMYNQKPIDAIKENKEEVFNNFEVISDHFIRLETNKQWTIDEIIEKTEVMVKRYGVKTLVIDPYNRLKNDFKDREDKYVGSILSKLCMLSKKLNILVIFVAHPKKTDDEDTIPNMYSISGSGDWYNMSDYGIIVHRPRTEAKELSSKPIISIGKIKNFSLGKPSGGLITLNYNKDKRILEDEVHNTNSTKNQKKSFTVSNPQNRKTDASAKQIIQGIREKSC